jgi:hypothetical protein
MVANLLFNYGRMDTMHLKGNQFIKVAFLLVITAFTITGCGGSLFTFNGYKVTQQNLTVQLEDGNQQGEWKTNELAIKYQYQMMPETLKIAGTTELLGGFATGFSQIGRLAVYLLFLDNQGIVIENSLIYSAGNHQSSNMFPMAFERTIPIPEGTRTISFAYDGVLVDPGDDGATSYSIGFSPSRQWALHR